jgi:hypothetical protein
MEERMATTKKKAPKLKMRPVLVLTGLRGVFFGYATKTTGEQVTITKARNVFYWSQLPKGHEGILGLATVGPQAGSKLGARVGSLTLRNISAIVECEKAATERFEAASWG